ncbi:MAG TPA: VOC family protein [Blastocatellia bacterium]|nr:VOC family protein [Blastocatellia bacterium]
MVINRSAPTATVVPILVYEDVGKAIDWLCRTFGFAERLRFERDGVISHAQLAVAEGAIMLGRQGGPYRAPRGDEVNAYVHVTVDDVDRHFDHSKQCGARILQQPTDRPFGERQYTVEDPAGHWWVFSQHISDLAPEDWGATTAPAK